jgi:hypothetical protein
MFDRLPDYQKVAFKSALSQVIGAYQRGDWFYLQRSLDLTSTPPFDRAIDSRGKLLVFVVDKTTYIPPTDSFSTCGCAAFAANKTGEGLHSCIDAKWTGTSWTFEPLFAMRKHNGSLQVCSLPSKR